LTSAPAPLPSQEDLFREAVDVLVAMVAGLPARSHLIRELGAALEITPDRIDHYLHIARPLIEATDAEVRVGRAVLPRAKTSAHRYVRQPDGHHGWDGPARPGWRLWPTSHTMRHRPASVFALTRLHACMLERIAVSVALNEAVLLVGETGTGVYPSMGARHVAKNAASSLGRARFLRQARRQLSSGWRR
jgi:midasin